MACTIDHLSADQHVTVLRDFTDLSGVSIRTGEKAIVRSLGLDSLRMEIWIELDRNGACDKLRFALRTTDGPRIGRMRDYFETCEPIPADDGRSAALATAQPSTPEVDKPSPAEPVREQSSAAFQPFVGKQASDDTRLGESRVACTCDRAFHRELLPPRSELSIYACLRCGTVTCSRSIGDDGRFTGNAWQENFTVELSSSVHRWISGWPRVKIDYTGHSRWPMSVDLVRYPTIYYPADTRCDDLAELAELESSLAREQAGQSPAAQLRATHRVRSGPPKELPEALGGYATIWEALQLRSKSDDAVLLQYAQLRCPGRELAAEILRQRPNACDRVVELLRSTDATQRGIGFVIARDMHPPDPRLAGVLIELLEKLSYERVPDEPMRIAGRGPGQLFLLLIADLRIATPEMLTFLRALMRKLARHDAFLTDCVRIVVRELTTAGATPAA